MDTPTVTTPGRNSAAAHAAATAATLWSELMARLSGAKSGHEGLADDCSRHADSVRVRRFAQQIMADDPRFAADLFAAADRYDRD